MSMTPYFGNTELRDGISAEDCTSVMRSLRIPLGEESEIKCTFVPLVTILFKWEHKSEPFFFIQEKPSHRISRQYKACGSRIRYFEFLSTSIRVDCVPYSDRWLCYLD